MEESKKKPIMIGVIIACLAVAGIITYSRSGGGGGVGSISEEEVIWVKCNNPSCSTEYQMSKKAYYKYMEANADVMSPTVPPLVCKQCSEHSAFLAEKCQNPNCGIVFFNGAVPNDFSDRCPECGQSATEESRKARMREMSGG